MTTTRTIDADTLQSSDHSKSYQLPNVTTTLAGLGNTTPLADTQVAAVGTSALAARADHIHPTPDAEYDAGTVTPVAGTSTASIDWNNGTSQVLRLSGTTVNLNLTNPKIGAFYKLRLTRDAINSGTNIVLPPSIVLDTSISSLSYGVALQQELFFLYCTNDSPGAYLLLNEKTYSTLLPALPTSTISTTNTSTLSALLVNSDIQVWGSGVGPEFGDNTTAQPLRLLPQSVVAGNIGFNRVTVGAAFVAGIQSNTGNIYSWGTNSNGSLGDNTTTTRSSPVSVVGGRSFSQIAGLGSTCLAIEGSTGNAYAWGTGTAARIGDGTTSNRSSPTSVLGGRSFREIATGSSISSAIEGSTGNAYAWGTGIVGDNTLNTASSPVSVVGGRSFTKIAGGSGVVCAIEGTTGNIYSWGNNANGDVGDNTTNNRSSPVSVVGGRSFTQVSSGAGQLAIEGSTGNLYGWGKNSSGQLGNGTLNDSSSPISVLGGRSFVSIAAGNSSSLAIESNGTIWGWGSGAVIIYTNVPYPFAPSSNIYWGSRSFNKFARSISNGTFAIEGSTGNAYGWGIPGLSLGDNTTTSRSSPVSVVGGRSFSQISSGTNVTTAIEGSTGNAYAWGNNSSGAVGDNTTTNRSSPVSVVGGRSFSNVTMSQSNTAAIEGSTGNAYTWGPNSSGQLGNNTVVDSSSPVSVVGGKSWSKISGYTDCFASIEGSTGNAYGWGSNGSGQLGDNTTTSRSSPVSVVGGRSFSQISSGTTATFAIEGSTGNAYAWGAGTSGQLGNNTTTNASSPVSILGGRSWSQISAGQLNICLAIEGSTGNAYAWGNNAVGRLGNNTLANSSSPVSIVGGRSFTQIFAGSCSTAIEGSTGIVYMWGPFNSGQSGMGYFAKVNSPVSFGRIR